MSQRQIENTIPVLAVSDLSRSIDFYGRVLGFEVEWNTGVICSVGRDQCSIMLEARAELSRGTVWVGLDGDAMFQLIERSGATVLQPPTNQPWAYEMKISDPDGNVIWLGAEPKH